MRGIGRARIEIVTAAIPYEIEIVEFAKVDGPLTKRIRLDSEGLLRSDGSACLMSEGTAWRRKFDRLEQFAACIANLAPNRAIALGALRPGLAEQVRIVTKDRLAESDVLPASETIARTGDYIAYRQDGPSLALIDIDTKGMSQAARKRIDAIGGFLPALLSVLPELGTVGHVIRASTGAGLSRLDTGERLVGSNGRHVFVLVRDGADIKRFLTVLHKRCWLAGFGWLTLGASGQFLERSPIDRTVFALERLVFEAAPILEPPLAQDLSTRMPMVNEGPPLDTRAACPDLSVVEQARWQNLLDAEKGRLRPEAEKARAAFVARQAEIIVGRTGCTFAAARHSATRQCDGILLPDVELPFDDAELCGATVGDVLARPDSFVGATLADPLEGPDYGRGKAKIMCRPDGSLWINSFAHGRTVYELKHDATSVEANLAAGNPAEAADRFVRLSPVADLSSAEELRLRDRASQLSGVKPRALKTMIDDARRMAQHEHVLAERERQAAEPGDGRVRLNVPPPDAERLPVLRAVDEVLRSVEAAEPPMRDLEGYPIEVRCRQPLGLHMLSAAGSNLTDPHNTRLPPPALPLLTRHTKYTVAHEIERHIEFVAGKNGNLRSVALPPIFVEHWIEYRDSTLPRVGCVATAPLVLPDGQLLARQGLHRSLGLLLRIDPALIAQLPLPSETGPEAVAAAMDFLTRDWLGDIATDFVGKCILIALILTILERVLLPERPAFFVTAGKRGGGKTTALTMAILAVTGHKPPAAAWSSNEEERRKAMLAHLSDGIPALVWDNIPLGTAISCPTLEKVLTTDSYTDRVLNQSASKTVPTHTVMCLTGNNIAPKGDMASRSLTVRLDVDRPDPENRSFKHPDPFGWTLDNRGRILRALYTVLLGNPQLRPDRAVVEKTRFKLWWRLIGSAVEHGASALVERRQAVPPETEAVAPVDFGALFAGVETDDEETSGLADMLHILQTTWPRSFQSSDIAKAINEPGEFDDNIAAGLRGFFDTTGRRQGSVVNPIAIGRRLQAIADAPVQVGNRILKLVKTSSNAPGQHRPKWYSVHAS
jgi:hypothetical protein